MKDQVAAARAAWRERLVQAVLAVVLWWTIYWRVDEVYGLTNAVVVATGTAWAYVFLSAFAAHLLNSRFDKNDRSKGPRSPSGRRPGAQP